MNGIMLRGVGTAKPAVVSNARTMQVVVNPRLHECTRCRTRICSQAPDSEVAPGMAEEEAPQGESLFTPAFKEIFQQAMARQRAEMDAAVAEYDKKHSAPIHTEEEVTQGNPFFNDNFKAILSGAMSRHGGPDVMFTGEREAMEVAKLSLQEETLLAALHTCKQTLSQLMILETEIGTAIARQEKQVERLQFALDKARMDAAYYRTLETLVEKSSE